MGDDVSVLVFSETVQRDHGQQQCFPRSRFGAERFRLVKKVLLAGGVDSVFLSGVFDLAQVDDAVLPVDQEVNLGAGVLLAAFPRIFKAADAQNAQSVLDLARMQLADPFKGKAAPCVVSGRIQ